jgi:hypothetical protein
MMNDREQRIREVIVQNLRLINELKLQNQSLAALLPRQRRKKVVFPPRPGAKKKGAARVEKN